MQTHLPKLKSAMASLNMSLSNISLIKSCVSFGKEQSLVVFDFFDADGPSTESKSFNC